MIGIFAQMNACVFKVNENIKKAMSFGGKVSEVNLTS